MASPLLGLDSKLIPDPVVEKRVALYNLGIWEQEYE